MLKVTKEDNISHATICVNVKTGINNVHACVHMEYFWKAIQETCDLVF